VPSTPPPSFGTPAYEKAINFLCFASIKAGCEIIHICSEVIIDKIHQFMVSFLTKKKLSLLATKTALKPKYRCATRWNSDYTMILRYQQLHAIINDHFLDEVDPQLMISVRGYETSHWI
jgi:hypothetical protein